MTDSSDEKPLIRLAQPAIEETITLEDGSTIHVVATLRGPQSTMLDVVVTVARVAEEAWQEPPKPATLKFFLDLGPLVDVLVAWEIANRSERGS